MPSEKLSSEVSLWIHNHFHWSSRAVARFPMAVCLCHFQRWSIGRVDLFVMRVEYSKISRFFSEGRKALFWWNSMPIARASNRIGHLSSIDWLDLLLRNFRMWESFSRLLQSKWAIFLWCSPVRLYCLTLCACAWALKSICATDIEEKFLLVCTWFACADGL